MNFSVKEVLGMVIVFALAVILITAGRSNATNNVNKAETANDNMWSQIDK